MLEVRLRPGWVMVSAESGRLLDEPDQLAVDLASVRHEGNGVYTITTGTDETFRLIKRVGPVDPGVNLAYTVHLGDMPGYDGDFDGVPTVDLTLSDRMVNDEVAPMLARALAESTAVLRGGRATDGDRVFGPGGTPDVDAVQRPVDAGHRAELRQRGLLERRLGRADFVRRTAVRKEIRKLALTMGVADGQPNAKLLRTLLTEDERAILDRAKDGGRPLEERVDQRGISRRRSAGREFPRW
ncbi:MULTISPECIES: hypothetical protein [unclassified Kribbella]|uniref:hypothetical protein n=1 Tax=unclassified Kribbella TaxID=2644121 RepID=UPI0030170500